MTSVEELATLCSALKKEHAGSKAASDLLGKVSAVYEAYLAAPESCFKEPKTKSYFVEEFTPEIVQSVMGIKKLEDNEVLVLFNS